MIPPSPDCSSLSERQPVTMSGRIADEGMAPRYADCCIVVWERNIDGNVQHPSSISLVVGHSSIPPSIDPSVYRSICHPSIHVSLHLSIHRFIDLSIHPPTPPPTHLHICPPVCPPVRPPAGPTRSTRSFIRMSTCQPAGLPVCPPSVRHPSD